MSLDADVLRVRTDLTHDALAGSPHFVALCTNTAPSSTVSPRWKPVADTPHLRANVDSWYIGEQSLVAAREPRSVVAMSLAGVDATSASDSPSWRRANVGSLTRPDLSMLNLDENYDDSLDEDSVEVGRRTVTGSRPITVKPKTVVSRSSAGADAASASDSPSWRRVNVGSLTRPDLSTLIFNLEEDHFNNDDIS